MKAEWEALSGLFPIDGVLEKWLRYKAIEASNEVSDAVTVKRPLRQSNIYGPLDKGAKYAKYAKYLYMNLSTLSPYVSGLNSVKISTPVEELTAQNIKIDPVSCTNSRASDLVATAKVFKDAVKETGRPVRIADGVFRISA